MKYLLFAVFICGASFASHDILSYPVDRGRLSDISANTPLTVTIALSLPDLAAAESLLALLHTPNSPQFNQFLTADQFVARFAPTKHQVDTVINSLSKYGLRAIQDSPMTLKVTGLPANHEKAFAVSLHQYDVPRRGYSYHAPTGPIAIPSEVAGMVSAVVGLDSRPRAHANISRTHGAIPNAQSPIASATSAYTYNPIGSWTVTDWANYYDVVPLYQRGLTGSGRTIGLIEFERYNPIPDSLAYWASLGLTVKPNRIQIIPIAGVIRCTPNASDSCGLETDIDVQQAGGLAPQANILVYQGPGDAQGHFNTYVAAINANTADIISSSWAFDIELGGEPTYATVNQNGKTVGFSAAMHDQFVRAAIQGQSVFESAGDFGAYPANGFYGLPENNPFNTETATLALSLFTPNSDPAVTAIGGTTLPNTRTFCTVAANGPSCACSSDGGTVPCTCTEPAAGCTTCASGACSTTVQNERVWGWDYLQDRCSYRFPGTDLYTSPCQLFPVGGGGGVSILFGTPKYQKGIKGIQRTQPNQALTIYIGGFGIPANAIFGPVAFPANFAGRNVPDISFNADPETGYLVNYTPVCSPSCAPQQIGFVGGTSFGAPQMGGIATLFNENSGKRMGLWNFPLYSVVQDRYGQPGAPLNAIKYGNNWFYRGSNGYNPGAGLGTLDIANFATFLRENSQ